MGIQVCASNAAWCNADGKCAFCRILGPLPNLDRQSHAGRWHSWSFCLLAYLFKSREMQKSLSAGFHTLISLIWHFSTCRVQRDLLRAFTSHCTQTWKTRRDSTSLLGWRRRKRNRGRRSFSLERESSHSLHFGRSSRHPACSCWCHSRSREWARWSFRNGA